jgi:hypothetical protein
MFNDVWTFCVFIIYNHKNILPIIKYKYDIFQGDHQSIYIYFKCSFMSTVLIYISRESQEVVSLVKIHWRMLLLECSQGCYAVKIWPGDLDLWPWKSIGFQILLRTFIYRSKLYALFINRKYEAALYRQWFVQLGDHVLVVEHQMIKFSAISWQE